MWKEVYWERTAWGYCAKKTCDDDEEEQEKEEEEEHE